MDYKVFCLFAIALIVGSFSSAHGQAALTEAQCSVEPIARVNCGAPGITPQECFNKGCCYDSSQPNAIWCFYSRPDDGNVLPVLQSSKLLIYSYVRSGQKSDRSSEQAGEVRWITGG
ncbi:putative gastrointestinal growth factor xP1 [Rhinophrynus dorsalis]